MSRASTTTSDSGLTGLSSLSSFNRQPLTPEQQMQALKRVQAQAEQRVKLGMQLFKAAEARLSSQTDVLQQIKSLQKQLKDEVNQDVAQTLHQYDQWIGQIDESFTTAIRKLEEKIDAVQSNLESSEARIQQMLERAEAMLDQSRTLIEQNSLKYPHASATKTNAKQETSSEVAQEKPNTSKPLPPIPPAPPKKNADIPIEFDTDTVIETPPMSAGEEKIYSKLLQRLIDENPGAESHNHAIEETQAKLDEDDSAEEDQNRADAA